MDEKSIVALAALTTNEGKLTPVGMAALRSRIAILEDELLKHPQVTPEVNNHFSKGVYAREMRLAKDTLVVGAIHKHLNMNIISKGKVTFFSIDGAKTVEAPYTFVASPGVKRVIYAHEDTVWTTIHGTNETDVAKIEAEFIAKNYEEAYLASERTLNDVLSIIGATPSELTAISENEADLTGFPEKTNVYIGDSAVHGKGIFASSFFATGEIIGYATYKGKRTPLGRYSNHGPPNAEMIRDENGDIVCVALKNIWAEEEILTDYFFNYKTAKGG